MKEELITFETAKLAKEKGFRNLQTFYKNKIEHYVDARGEKTDDTYSNIVSVTEEITPSQSILQKWLRESHNIDVWAVPFKNIDDEKAYDFISNDEIYSEKLLGYETYEEALEQGLIKGLKLI